MNSKSDFCVCVCVIYELCVTPIWTIPVNIYEAILKARLSCKSTFTGDKMASEQESREKRQTNTPVYRFVFRIASLTTKTTKFPFTDFLSWVKGQRSGSSRFGETKNHSSKQGSESVAEEKVSLSIHRNGQRTIQPRFQSRDPPEW